MRRHRYVDWRLPWIVHPLTDRFVIGVQRLQIDIVRIFPGDDVILGDNGKATFENNILLRIESTFADFAPTMNGVPVLIDPIAATSVRTVSPGEYAPGVQTVVTAGRLRQGVREDAATVTAAIRIRGGRL